MRQGLVSHNQANMTVSNQISTFTKPLGYILKMEPMGEVERVVFQIYDNSCDSNIMLSTTHEHVLD